MHYTAIAPPRCIRSYKALIAEDYEEEDMLYMKPILGELRTKAAAVEAMHTFEKELAKHMKQFKKKYAKKIGGERALTVWMRPNLGHLPNHPAETWIKKYSKDHMYNVRHMPTFPELSEKNLIFDMLHGLLNCTKVRCRHVHPTLRLHAPSTGDLLSAVASAGPDGLHFE